MKYLIQFLKKQKGLLAAVSLLLTGQVVGTLLVPYLIADMIDMGVLKGDMDTILRTGIWMLVVAFVTTIISVYGSYLSAAMGAALGRDMREAVFRKSQELSVKDLDVFGTSSMITRTTGDISNIQQTFVMVLQMIIPAPMVAVAAIGMTAASNPVLTLIPVISIAIFLLAASIVMKKSNSLSQRIQVHMDKINQVVRESIVGIRVIRAFHHSDYEKKRSDGTFEEYASIMISLNKLFAALNPVVWLVMGLAMAAIVWLGGIFALQGTMNIGEITAVTEYTIVMLSYLIMAAFSVVTLPKMHACLERLSEVLNTQPQIVDTPNVVQVSINKQASLEVEHVTFSYRGAEMPVLKDLSFCCQAGKTTAIIGGTGSGKSTIAGLLLRLHDIDSGFIRLGGNDIRKMTQQSLREQIGYVPQKAFLFSGTIADNLRMGRKDATQEEMRQAVRIAQAETFIDSLPNGFDAPVAQGGTNFSGGQKQRISIARALVKEAPVLIFDDSFSALDFKTDAALRKALKKEIKNSVVIIIAQRISTILDADQIIVLDEGCIAGIGKHKELMETCEIYQEIAKSQLSTEESEAV